MVFFNIVFLCLWWHSRCGSHAWKWLSICSHFCSLPSQGPVLSDSTNKRLCFFHVFAVAALFFIIFLIRSPSITIDYKQVSIFFTCNSNNYCILVFPSIHTLFSSDTRSLFFIKKKKIINVGLCYIVFHKCWSLLHPSAWKCFSLTVSCWPMDFMNILLTQ